MLKLCEQDVIYMPSEGQKGVTLTSDVIEKIDALRDKKNRTMNSRPDVINTALEFYIKYKDKVEGL